MIIFDWLGSSQCQPQCIFRRDYDVKKGNIIIDSILNCIIDVYYKQGVGSGYGVCALIRIRSLILFQYPETENLANCLIFEKATMQLKKLYVLQW